jgi:hypothetical protein
VAVLACSLLAAGVGMLVTDTLCPEHRALVMVLGVVVLAGSFACGVALLMNRPFAPVLALIPALAGVTIGFVDALHDLTRGRVISLAFGVAAVGAAVLSFQAMRTAVWARRIARDMRPLDEVELAVPPNPTGLTSTLEMSTHEISTERAVATESALVTGSTDGPSTTQR